MGYRVPVLVVPLEQWPHEDACGIFIPARMEIRLREDDSQQALLHAFLHELMHACLHLMNSPLYSDEAHVDVLSGLLQQALSTAEPAAPIRRKPKRAR